MDDFFTHRSDFRSFLDQLEETALWIGTESQNFEYISAGFEDIWGISPEIVENRFERLIEGIHPEDRDQILEQIERYEQKGTEQSFEHRVVQPDGTIRWVHTRQFILQTDEGDPTVRFGITTDITEQKQRERELEETNTLLSTLFETLPVCVTVLDTDGTITRANHRAEAVLGLTKSELTERTYDDPEWRIVDEDGNPIPDEDLPFARVMETGETVIGYEHGIRWPDGTERWLSINAAPLTTSDGTITGVVAAITDITDQRDQERVLKQQNERLDQFTSVVSHDLRNPLNVAEGRLELAREECDSEHLESVRCAHERMGILIDDLLTLAREGKEIGEFEPVALGDLVEICWQSVDAPKATLAIEIERTIRADGSRLQQLLENLMRNAVEHGGDDVTVTVGALEDGFYVEDDGPGTPEGDRDEVFEAGYSRSNGGTGFGLSIVKRVVDAHGWEIHVTEGSEGGAQFEITGVEFVTA